VTTRTLQRWLDAGDEEYADFPIAANFLRALSSLYSFPDDFVRLIQDIQRKRPNEPRCDAISIATLVQFLAEKGALDGHGSYTPSLLKQHSRARSGCLLICS
jgi:hypothetical protein